MDEPQLLAEVEYKPNATIITMLSDYLMDEAALAKLREMLEPMIMDTTTRTLILDFSNVRSLSSSAIGYLVALKQRMDKKDGRLIICCVENKVKNTPQDKFVYEIFKVVKLDRYFELSPNVTAALRLLEKD